MSFGGCKKDKFITDTSARLHFSTDTVLFDTVFTTKGSSTRNFRIINPHNNKIKISSISLGMGESSPFFLNVDGTPGRQFSDLELAANDSMYVFVQVNVDPNNSGSPIIISDKVVVSVNGSDQTLELEAWGQDAYYHTPTRALPFKDGSYMPYSTVDTLTSSYTMAGRDYIWKNDKPHVIYGYLVIDSAQRLRIPAGTKVYLNYKAGIWVYRYGQIRVLGTRGNEVRFEGARRERDYNDEPGQWDRIWINEGSDDNLINYAIIKNGFIGIQAELFDPGSFYGPGTVTIRNTVIQNMSMWGIYGLAYKIIGGNNLVTNCQEHSVNLSYGGTYKFYHCTFANYWSKSKQREKPTININNYTPDQVLFDTVYFGNCIIDGKLENEISLDVKNGSSATPVIKFSNCWLKTNLNITDTARFFNVRKGSDLKYAHIDTYNFEPKGETQVQGFNNPKAFADLARWDPLESTCRHASLSIL